MSISAIPDSQLMLGESGAVLDWSRSTVAYGDNRVMLTRMELRLLIALLEYAPGTAPRQQIIAMMWGESRWVRRHRSALPVWIFALRRRLAAIGLRSAIRTVRREGYCLTL
jgi:DNA-binding winged helix-turn-helix (wHTH) protein